ncbi:high-affinity branched-chain amino acid transport permease protein [[Synechococcus] sp. NIES-970]|uniref:branched-chain amino acid ABC transporter permease n=1 Tax=Picosynechococcus sp. NKBG15041c TaxID=1407650 RepID=UPI000405C80D|nr:branched-chain amino acid ABC transporter permease [Picosynechococcus sp. NKBG15041c]BAW97364.1 high-affinity branched-chain amino acid transport permease protein [[Synechococcus] sp. NIES-970]
MDTLQLVLNGLSIGSILALAAVGLTLTYGILRLSNFAHGDYMTLGAYITWLSNSLGLNIWPSMAIGAFGTIGGMLIAEKLLWQPMRDKRATPTTLIIISIGLALFLRSTVLFIWGSSNQQYDLPVVQAINLTALVGLPDTVPALRIAYYRVVVVVLTILVILGLHFILQNSKIGKAMRAVADNIDLARVSGIDVERVVLWTWVITGSLTAIAGSMYGLITTVRPNMGWFLILPMFASVILGGIGNPYGAIAGAFVIGIAQEVSVTFLGPDYKLGVALFIMVVLLLIRPQGLFKGTM